MVYSSAFYRFPDQTLEEAQATKLTRIAKLLDLQGGEDVFEIGCGWWGARVTGLTLSLEQLAYTRELGGTQELARLGRFSAQGLS